MKNYIPRILTPAIFRTLFQATRDPRDRICLSLAGHGALQPREVDSYRLGQVDWDRKNHSIITTEARGWARYGSITPALFDELVRFRDIGFEPTEPIVVKGHWSDRFRSIAREAGLPHLSSTDLRYTCVIAMLILSSDRSETKRETDMEIDPSVVPENLMSHAAAQAWFAVSSLDDPKPTDLSGLDPSSCPQLPDRTRLFEPGMELA